MTGIQAKVSERFVLKTRPNRSNVTEISVI